MPSKKRNEGRQEYHYEKWQTSNSRRMPNLWHQDVQNRKELIWKKGRSWDSDIYKKELSMSVDTRKKFPNVTSVPLFQNS